MGSIDGPQQEGRREKEESKYKPDTIASKVRQRDVVTTGSESDSVVLERQKGGITSGVWRRTILAIGKQGRRDDVVLGGVDG